MNLIVKLMEVKDCKYKEFQAKLDSGEFDKIADDFRY